MKGSKLALVMLCVLFAIPEARSKDTVKLCGLEYVRTVVYICATSRWRRQAEGIPPALQAEKRNSFLPPDRHEASEENPARSLAEVDFSGEELVREGRMPVQALRRAEKRSVMLRRDLRTLCCTTGCSMTELSALC
ncbi:insulin-like peptide INSL5 [Cavia porcellus]|nr:insulin-like peptide INSL5 [Cavia porcellus]